QGRGPKVTVRARARGRSRPAPLLTRAGERADGDPVLGRERVPADTRDLAQLPFVMSQLVAQAPPEELELEDAEPHTIEAVGGPSFSDLVRAHYKWEQARPARNGAALHKAQDEFNA